MSHRGRFPDLCHGRLLSRYVQMSSDFVMFRLLAKTSALRYNGNQLSRMVAAFSRAGVNHEYSGVFLQPVRPSHLFLLERQSVAERFRSEHQLVNRLKLERLVTVRE